MVGKARTPLEGLLEDYRLMRRVWLAQERHAGAAFQPAQRTPPAAAGWQTPGEPISQRKRRPKALQT